MNTTQKLTAKQRSARSRNIAAYNDSVGAISGRKWTAIALPKDVANAVHRLARKEGISVKDVMSKYLPLDKRVARDCDGQTRLWED